MMRPVRSKAPSGYSAEGVWDEAVAPDGQVRPLYEELLGDLSDADLFGLCDAVCDSMASQGVTFGDEVFPVDPVPRLIEAREWDRVARGVKQRGRALASFVHDVYGERTIVAAGIVPERTIECASGFEPWMMGVPVSTAGFLAGLDLVRCEDGELRVLEDNTRTPSGIAYAAAVREVLDVHLPTRCPASRPDPTGAFDLLLATLLAASPEGVSDPQLALLSDGPANSAFYEHRQIADRLEIPIVTPRDLAPRGSALHARIDGRSRRVDVLLRRTDEDRLRDENGRPTWIADLLLEPARRGALTLVNPLGAGVADDKAVHAYVEGMVRFYLGEEPLLESVSTLDLSDPEVLEDVRARIPELVIKPRGGSGGEGIVIGPHATDEDRERIARRITEEPDAWAAQETVAISTHPTVCDEGLRPRHVDLRPFAIGGDEAAAAAPGLLTRVAFDAGALMVNSSQRGGAKDTWVVA